MKTQMKGKRNQRKIRINYFKMVRSLIILGVIIYFIILGISNLFTILKTEDYTVEYTTYYVSKGETLWSIAEQQNFDNMDIREIVYMIRKDNNGIDGNLSIGQEIKLRTIYQ